MNWSLSLSTHTMIFAWRDRGKEQTVLPLSWGSLSHPETGTGSWEMGNRQHDKTHLFLWAITSLHFSAIYSTTQSKYLCCISLYCARTCQGTGSDDSVKGAAAGEWNRGGVLVFFLFFSFFFLLPSHNKIRLLQTNSSKITFSGSTQVCLKICLCFKIFSLPYSLWELILIHATSIHYYVLM